MSHSIYWIGWIFIAVLQLHRSVCLRVITHKLRESAGALGLVVLSTYTNFFLARDFWSYGLGGKTLYSSKESTRS